MLVIARDLQKLFLRDTGSIKIIRQGLDIHQTSLAEACRLSVHDVHCIENNQTITETKALTIASGLTYIANKNQTVDKLRFLLISQCSALDAPHQIGKTALLSQCALAGGLIFNPPTSVDYDDEIIEIEGTNNTNDEKSIKRRRVGD